MSQSLLLPRFSAAKRGDKLTKSKLSRHLAIAVLLLVTTTAGGCRSSDEYVKLSQAGKTYAEALDTLLDFTADTQITESSEALLSFDRDKPQTRQDYLNIAKEERIILDAIARIKEHNRLVVRYFSLLQDLAGSNAPDKASAEVGTIATNLNKLGEELRGSPLLSERQSRLAQGVTKLLISSRIRGALRQELEVRGPTLLRELQTQEELLSVLGSQLKRMLTRIKGFREQRLVIEPYAQTDPLTSEESWIATRKDTVKLQVTAEELENASSAIAEFRGIFQDFVEGRSSQGRINNLLADVENLLSVIETLKEK
ncbi:hypothetical protein ACQ4M3_25705 [Leptolyngbya sp. AN03gr2]|uniref:hypothetical protein n=1 Tax=unclassified Leptolyngbya TaxID=2650499 RepID=UPI003D32144B